MRYAFVLRDFVARHDQSGKKDYVGILPLRQEQRADYLLPREYCRNRGDEYFASAHEIACSTVWCAQAATRDRVARKKWAKRILGAMQPN